MHFRNTFNYYALLALVAVLVTAWIYIVTVWPIEFWYCGDEYAYLSLAHALNLEVRLRDGLAFPDSGLGNHPGVPLYIVSWLCLRAVALLTGHRDAVSYALAEPNAFYFATRIAAGLVAMASVVGAYFVLDSLAPWKRLIAISSYFAVDSWSLTYGLTSLGNETFALPSAVLFFWCVNKVVSSPKEAQLPWVYVGGAAALGYLIKPPYLSLLGGGLALACAMAARYDAPLGLKFKYLGKRILIMLGSFSALWAIVLLAAEGSREFGALIKGHADLFLHTGVLGGTPGHNFSLDQIYSALMLISSTTLPFAITGAAVALAYVIFSKWRAGTLDDRTLLWGVALAISSSLASLAVLSHFRAYYYVPAVSCFLPFMLKPVLERRGFAIIVAIAVLFTVPDTFRLGLARSAGQSRLAGPMKADEATIDALPLDEGEARLWTYGLSGKAFVKEFVLQLAGLQSYVHEREKEPSKDISSFAHVVRPYRYIVFARGSYRDIETLRDRAAHDQLAQPNGMTVTIPDNAIYRQLLDTIVVEIPKTVIGHR